MDSFGRWRMPRYGSGTRVKWRVNTYVKVQVDSSAMPASEQSKTPVTVQHGADRCRYFAHAADVCLDGAQMDKDHSLLSESAKHR